MRTERKLLAPKWKKKIAKRVTHHDQVGFTFNICKSIGIIYINKLKNKPN